MNSLKNCKSIKIPFFKFDYISLMGAVVQYLLFNIKIPKTISTIPGEFRIHQVVKKNTCNVMKIFSKIPGFAMDA